MWVAVTIAAALCAGLLIPYLVEEIRRGKVELGPRSPTGAGDTRAGYRGNPLPGQRATPTRRRSGTLSLQSFHLVFIALSIVLASGTGLWALLQQRPALAAVTLGLAVVLIAYAGYFVRKAEKVFP